MANALLAVDVNAANATSDALKVGGSISVNGNLNLNNLGTKAFADGDEFKILNVTGTISGAFATITPELPKDSAGIRANWFRMALLQSKPLQLFRK